MNKDNRLIDDFGNEWNKFNQENISIKENKKIFKNYFELFPFDTLSEDSIGIDIGSGSGRWSYFLANKFKKIYLLEPSLKAIEVSKKNLSKFDNIIFFNNDIDNIPLPEDSVDFAYCLGVLHHVPDINLALKKIYKILKKDSPFLLYIYYAFDNKPVWFKSIWYVSNILRLIISTLPFFLKSLLCDLIAIFIYFPLARISKLLFSLGIDASKIPLSWYHNKSIKILRNDSLDRFGTRLEHRLTQNQIKQLLINNNFKDIVFSKNEPFWCVICYKN